VVTVTPKLLMFQGYVLMIRYFLVSTVLVLGTVYGFYYCYCYLKMTLA